MMEKGRGGGRKQKVRRRGREREWEKERRNGDEYIIKEGGRMEGKEGEGGGGREHIHV